MIEIIIIIEISNFIKYVLTVCGAVGCHSSWCENATLISVKMMDKLST